MYAECAGWSGVKRSASVGAVGGKCNMDSLSTSSMQIVRARIVSGSRPRSDAVVSTRDGAKSPNSKARRAGGASVSIGTKAAPALSVDNNAATYATLRSRKSTT